MASIEELQAQLEERDRELEELADNYEKEIKEQDDLIQELKKKTTSLEQSVKDKDDEIAALLEEFDKELGTKDKEIEELQARVATGGGGGGGVSEEEMAKLEEELLQADQELEKSKAQVKTLTIEIDSLKGTISKLEKTEKSAESENELRNELKSLTSEVNNLKGNVSKLEKEVSTKEETIERGQHTIRQLESEIGTLKASASGSSSELVQKIQQLEKELAESDEAVAALEKNLKNAKEKLTESEKDLDTADAALEQSQREIANLKKELASASASTKNSSSSSSNDSGSAAMAPLQEELAAQKKINDESKTEIDKLVKQVENSKKEVASSKKEVESLKKEVETLKKEVEKGKLSPGETLQARVAARRAEGGGDGTQAEQEVAKDLQRKQAEMMEKQRILKESMETCGVVLKEIVKKPEVKVGDVMGEIKHLVTTMQHAASVLDSKIKSADGGAVGDLGDIFAPKKEVVSSMVPILEKLRPLVLQGLQSMLQHSEGGAEHGWVSLKTDLKIEISTLQREDDAMPISRGQATIAAPPDVVFSVLKNYDAAKTWDPRGVKSINLIKDIDEGIQVVHYARTFNSMMVSDRDFCVVHYARMLLGQPQLTFVKMMVSFPDEACPPSDMERADCLPSGFIIKAAKDNPKTSHVTFIQHMDLKGFLPAVIADTLISDAPLCIAKIRMMVTTARK